MGLRSGGDAVSALDNLNECEDECAQLRADAERYRRIRAAHKFIGMLEFAVAHAGTDEEYDAAVDTLPVRR